jgi:hypothetical protein
MGLSGYKPILNQGHCFVLFFVALGFELGLMLLALFVLNIFEIASQELFA